MPIVDTEFLFALNPGDTKHEGALKMLEDVQNEKMKDLAVTDTAIFEYYSVLRSRGFASEETKSLLDALNKIFEEYSIKEINTINKDLLLRQLSVEADYNLDFFNSLLAASAENHDHSIISDDKAYDKLRIKRVALGGEK